MARAYYNEIDPYAAQWLRNLIGANLIAPGDVDERSIRDVQAIDLAGYDQVHLFAGLGIWSYALRSAGWDDARPVWSGSCPCQPFSVAGKQKGVSDDRHLWPEMLRLVREWQPPTLFGEQVAGRAGYDWVSTVSADLAREGYEFGCADLAAAGCGAPHIRQRVFWVANNNRERRGELGSAQLLDRERETFGDYTDRRCKDDGCGVADTLRERRQQIAGSSSRDEATNGRARRNGCEPNCNHELTGDGEDIRMADATSLRHDGRRASQTFGGSEQPERSCDAFWGGHEWIYCQDGKWRPVKPGVQPLAHGDSYRVDSGSPLAGKHRQALLKAIGNAIVAPLATEFVRAYMGCRP